MLDIWFHPPQQQNHSADKPANPLVLAGLCRLPAGARGSVCDRLSSRATGCLLLLRLLPQTPGQMALWGLFSELDPASLSQARTAVRGGGLALSRTLPEPLASRKGKEAERGQLEVPQGGMQPPLDFAGQVLPSAGAAALAGPSRADVLTKCPMAEGEEAQRGHLIQSPH